MRLLSAMLVILFYATAVAVPPGEPQEEIRSKQAELTKLRKEIEEYETKIKKNEKSESTTLDKIETIDRQVNLIRKLVRKLHEEERNLQQGIDSTRTSIGELGGQLTTLKAQYAQSVTALYRRGTSHDIELLLKSQSLNQVFVRAAYLHRFSQQRRSELQMIISQREEVTHRSEQLERKLSEQRAVIAAKAKEEARLTTNLKKRKQLLTSIRRDKKSLRQEMQRRVTEQQKLERIIADLIEKERIRKAREAENLKSPKPSTASALDGRKGKLPWPVSSGRLVARFGNQQHPVLKTITQNTGIDIALPVGSNVGVVAGGEISTIAWLPSFGNLVIVDHYGGYRTVYANLAEVSVSEGQRVMQGTMLGKSGESLSGPMLHFEIWKDRDKQDPEDWLTPKGLSQR